MKAFDHGSFGIIGSFSHGESDVGLVALRVPRVAALGMVLLLITLFILGSHGCSFVLGCGSRGLHMIATVPARFCISTQRCSVHDFYTFPLVHIWLL